MAVIFPSELVCLVSSYFDQSDFDSYVSLAFTCKRNYQILWTSLQDHRRQEQLLKPFIVEEIESSIADDKRNYWSQKRSTVTLSYKLAGRRHGAHELWLLQTYPDYDHELEKTIGSRDIAHIKKWLESHQGEYFLKEQSTYKFGLLDGRKRIWEQVGYGNSTSSYISSEASYKRDRLHGLYSCMYNWNSQKNSGQYNEGNKIGLWQEYYSRWAHNRTTDPSIVQQREYYNHNGELMCVENFVNNASWSITFPKETINYKGSSKHGYHHVWHMQADKNFYNLLCRSYYEEGLREGCAEEWYPNGLLRSYDEYKGGYRNGVEMKYSPDGSIMLKATRKDDEYHGEIQVWYRDLSLDHRHHYRYGQFHGNCQSWWVESGIMHKDENYFEGVRHGSCHYYYKSGRRQLSQEWDYSKLVSEARWPEFENSDDDYIGDVFNLE